MRNFPSEKALVTAYWRKLARSNGAARKRSSHVIAGQTRRRLRTRQHHASHPRSRRYGTASSEAAKELLGPRAQIHSNS
jgi:hypothetical protein